MELDSSYYAIPEVEHAHLWAERTPPEFKFHVKAFRLFTKHWATLDALPPELRSQAAPFTRMREHLYADHLPAPLLNELWAKFKEAIAPLRSAGKLGVVLLQFAPWMVPDPEGFAYLEACKAHLQGYEVAVEFRNASWVSEERREPLFSYLRKAGLDYVVVDEPQGYWTSIPPVIDVTGPTVYVRFHGRSGKTWKRPATTVVDRFSYWYSDEELSEWVPKLAFLNRSAKEVSVLFNTNYADQGPQNARRLAGLLHEAGHGAEVEALERVLSIPQLPPLREQ